MMDFRVKLYEKISGEMVDEAVEHNAFEIPHLGSLYPGKKRSDQWVVLQDAELQIDDRGWYLRLTVREMAG